MPNKHFKNRVEMPTVYHAGLTLCMIDGCLQINTRACVCARTHTEAPCVQFMRKKWYGPFLYVTSLNYFLHSCPIFRLRNNKSDY